MRVQVGIVNKIITLSFFIMLCNCASEPLLTLSDAGAKVKFLDSDEVSFNCTALQDVVILQSSSILPSGCHKNPENVVTALTNHAASIGATHIFIMSKNTCSGKAETFKCSNTFGGATPDLLKMCDEGNSMACLDAAFNFKQKDDNDVESRIPLYQKACSLKNKQGCQALSDLEQTLEKEKVKSDTQKICDKGEAKSCMMAAFINYNDNDLVAAAKYSQLACMLGSAEGCTSAKTLSGQINEVSRQRLAQQMQNQQIAFEAEERKRDRIAAALRNLGNSGHRSVNCTTQTSGNTAYTNCN